MAIYSQESVTRTTHRWMIPTGSHGAPAEEITKAWMPAEENWLQNHKLMKNAPLSGDTLRFTGEDDHIAISYTAP